MSQTATRYLSFRGTAPHVQRRCKRKNRRANWKSLSSDSARARFAEAAKRSGDMQRRTRGSASHKHIPNYCALRWRARAVVSSIRPRSNSKEVPLEGHRYIEGIVLVIFAIFCEKDFFASRKGRSAQEGFERGKHQE